MALIADPSSSAFHLKFPPSAGGGLLHSRSLSQVRVHPVALFTILDHYLRRNDEQPRVIGTLLGVRTENEIEVRNAFSVPHNETQDQVQVDMEYHRAMVDLHQKVNPNEVIVGWYATGLELNTYSALIQDFYSRETAPHQAVHLTMDTNVKDKNLGVKSYVSSPIGVAPKPENCVFLPVRCELLYHSAERSGLELLSRTATANASTASPATDMDSLATSLETVLGMLERVLSYVRAVIAGEKEGDPVVGKYILDTISVVPIGEDGKGLEAVFNSHLQDVLMVSYLANVIRSQVEISSRLTLLT